MTKKTKNKILYIDVANSIDDIRIAEKSIWVEEIPKHGYQVHYLLMNDRVSKKIKSAEATITTRYKSFILSYIVFVFRLIKVVRTFHPKFIVIRNRVDLASFVFIFYGLISKIKIVYIKAFPQLELMISKTSNKIRVLVLKLVLQWEIFLMKRSDILIVRSKKHDLLLKEKYRIRRNTLIISMGVNMALLKEINQETKERIRTDYGLSKAFLGVYFGVLGKGRKIEFIIDIIKDVQTNHSNLDFLIIGGEQNDIARLKQYAVNNNVDIVFTGNLDRKNLFNLLQMADFSISAIPPTKVFEMLSPTKVYESLQHSCPVLINREIPDQYEIIKQSQAGLIHNYKKEEFVSSIDQILKGEFDLKTMGENGYNYIIKNSTYTVMTNQIIKELQQFED